MATTVEVKSREPTSQPTAGPPWYMKHQRKLMLAAALIAVAAIVGWFVLASGKRKEQFAARSLNPASFKG